MGDMSSAMKTVTRAIECNPNVGKYYIIRTKLYIRMNNLRRAATDLSKLISLEKKNTGVKIMEEEYMADLNTKYHRTLGTTAPKIKVLLEAMSCLEKSLISSYETGIKFKLQKSKRKRKERRKSRCSPQSNGQKNLSRSSNGSWWFKSRTKKCRGLWGRARSTRTRRCRIARRTCRTTTRTTFR